MSELKPCPFCGRQPYESGGYVSCHTELCLANADYHEPAIGSITDWNTRPIEYALNARIAELEGLVDELIEEGAWGAELAINIGALSGDDQYKLAKKRYDKWYALVKDWKEREE